MEEILKLDPIKKVGGSVDLPGSKSISNRALLLAALSEGTTELQNLLAAEDTEMMIGALEALGVKLEVSDNGTVVKVEGCGGNFPVKKADLFLGNAGTVRSLRLWLSAAENMYWTALPECASVRLRTWLKR